MTRKALTTAKYFLLLWAWSGCNAAQAEEVWRINLECALPLPGGEQPITFGYVVVTDTLTRESLAVYLEGKAKEIKYEIFAAQVRRAAKVVREFPEEVFPRPSDSEGLSAPPWTCDGVSLRGAFKWEGRPAAVVLKSETAEVIE